LIDGGEDVVVRFAVVVHPLHVFGFEVREPEACEAAGFVDVVDAG